MRILPRLDINNLIFLAYQPRMQLQTVYLDFKYIARSTNNDVTIKASHIFHEKKKLI